MATAFENVKAVLGRAFHPGPGPGNPWPLFWFQFKNILLSRKKTPLLLAFLLVPVALTIMLAGELSDWNARGDEIATATGGRAWFQDILSAVFFPLLIPIVTAVYATGTIGEEVEGKTLPYLFTRPVYRSWILLAKTLSFLLASMILGIVAVSITYFVAVSITENPLRNIDELFGYWSAVALTVFSLGGLYLLLGVSFRFAMILVVIYTFLWETVLGGLPLPASVLQYSFVWYERAYINSFIGREAGFVTGFLVDVPSAGEAATILLTIGVLGFLGALVVVSYRDYNV